MQLTTKDLFKITKLLLKYAERRGYAVVQFANQDSWYQKIWHKDRNFEVAPPETIGDLDDDLEYLNHVLKDKYNALPYALERLGAVFNMLGTLVSRDTFLDDMIRPRGVMAEKLTTKQLLKVTGILLQYIDEWYNCTLVSFSHEDSMYQKICYQDFDFGGSPKITVVDVNEDMKQLKDILDKKRIPVPYDLERLGAVYNTLGAVLSLQGLSK